MPHAAVPYTKPAKTIQDLLHHLVGKGLNAAGLQPKALSSLQFIGYYRLLIYMRPLQDHQSKVFYPGIDVDDILAASFAKAGMTPTIMGFSPGWEQRQFWN
jgi:abortive infection bacteriophage resistance protein